ncbi:MAG: type IV pilus biogenesis/stability protein PilW [Methylophilaceae bacterium]|nr:type IV pilus biogenesis/stability protein PilW [Methylophilaceae bacterium]
MKKCLVGLLLVLAGCASQPSIDGSKTYTNTGDESPSRYRARLHTDLGAGYYAQGQIAVALEEFSIAAQIDPSYAQAHNGLGLVYAALREDEKAESSFRRALQLDPNSSEAHNNYGTFLCSRNRVDESIKEFLAALKNPLYVTPEAAWMNAGICALKKGNDKEAETYLQNALQAKPGLRTAHYQLAKLYFTRGDHMQADKHFRQSMQEGEPTPEMLWLGIQIARAVGDKNAEASHALLLRNQFPDSEEAKTLQAESASGR